MPAEHTEWVEQWTELVTTSRGEMILENEREEIMLVVPIRRFHPSEVPEDHWDSRLNLPGRLTPES